MSEWQPMSTAPKDDRFLAMVEGDIRVVRYGKTSHVPIYGWVLVDQGAEDCDLCEPTCWHPLPHPPFCPEFAALSPTPER